MPRAMKSAKEAAKPPGRKGKKDDKWDGQQMLAQALATCGRRGLRLEEQRLSMEDVLQEFRRMQEDEAGDEGTLRNRVLCYRILELCPDNPFVERTDSEKEGGSRQVTTEEDAAADRMKEEEEDEKAGEGELEEEGGGEEPAILLEAEGEGETVTREEVTVVAPPEASPLARLELRQSQAASSRQASSRGSPAREPVRLA